MEKKTWIGPRMYKTGIAAGLALLIAQLLRTESPFFAVIAAVVVLQPTVHESITVSKQRLLGTFVGIGVGIIFALSAPENPVGVGLGIVIVLAICNLFGWTGSSGLACIVFASLTTKPGDPFVGGVFRVIDTCIGMGVAVLVNYSIAALPLEEHAAEILKRILERILLLSHKSVGQYLEGNVDGDELEALQEEIQSLFVKAEKVKYNYKKEAKYKSYKVNRMEEFDCIYEVLWEAYVHVIHLGQEVQCSQCSQLPKRVFHSLKELTLLIEDKHQVLADRLYENDASPLDPIQQKISDIESILTEEKESLLKNVSLEDMRHFLNFFSSLQQEVRQLKKLGDICKTN